MRISSRINKATKRHQKGVAMIEFALVFTIVWAVLWSMVCYVAPLIVLQTMHRATAEGARVGAMITNPALRIEQAKAAAHDEMLKLPASWRAGYTAPNVECVPEPNGCLLRIIISQPYAANAPLKPIVGLPGIGTIPKLPTTLSSKAELLLQ
ncbi:MAG: hypothetical protein U0998_10450 [Moraxellaceae bacterium]|nr:hypothetical protein [Moraxellaceae bacterium]MDZ4387594.1 hypothetical protein [Moraxellaceae bacterium]